MRFLVCIATLVLLLSVTSCSSSTRCSGQRCTVNITGTQSVELDDYFDSNTRSRSTRRNRSSSGDVRIRVEAIQPNAVTVSSEGSRATIQRGASAAVGRVAIRVTTIQGDKVTLEVVPA